MKILLVVLIAANLGCGISDVSHGAFWFASLSFTAAALCFLRLAMEMLSK